MQLNGEREELPHQQNEGRDTNFSRKEKKEILVGIEASGCPFRVVLTFLHVQGKGAGVLFTMEVMLGVILFTLNQNSFP